MKDYDKVYEVRHVNVHIYKYTYTFQIYFTKEKAEEILRGKTERKAHKMLVGARDTLTVTVTLSNTQSNLREESPDNMSSASDDNLL